MLLNASLYFKSSNYRILIIKRIIYMKTFDSVSKLQDIKNELNKEKCFARRTPSIASGKPGNAAKK